MKHYFSLIELLVAISIIAILAGMVIGGMSAVSDKSNMTDTKATIMMLDDAIKKYKHNYGEYPTSLNTASDNDLTASSFTSSDNPAKLLARGATDFVDAWGEPLYVVFPEHYTSSSYALQYTVGGEGSTTETYYNQTSFQIISGGPDLDISTQDDNIVNAVQDNK